MKNLAISLLIGLFLLISKESDGAERDLCYATGPHQSVRSAPRVDADKMEKIVQAAAAVAGFGFVTDKDWDCSGADRDFATCMETTLCGESLYLEVREDASGTTYAIVAEKRGTLANYTGTLESEFLGALKTDIQTLLGRKADQGFVALKSTLDHRRTIALEQDADSRYRDADQSIAERRFQRRLGVTVALGGLTLAATAIAVNTGIAADRRYDTMEDADDADATRRLLTVSRAAMGCAIAAGVSTAVVLPFVIKARRNTHRLGFNVRAILTARTVFLGIEGAF